VAPSVPDTLHTPDPLVGSTENTTGLPDAPPVADSVVEGTEWLTEDLCAGTLICVTRDEVLVTNLVSHHRVMVHAGHHYLANAA
jgi:hypothetical protein